jgi:hypothetical protein
MQLAVGTTCVKMGSRGARCAKKRTLGDTVKNQCCDASCESTQMTISTNDKYLEPSLRRKEGFGPTSRSVCGHHLRPSNYMLIIATLRPSQEVTLRVL